MPGDPHPKPTDHKVYCTRNEEQWSIPLPRGWRQNVHHVHLQRQ